MRRSPKSAACALAALALFASPATASQQCHVTFRVDGPELLGALELRVDYSAAAGTFDGTGEGVKCTGLAPVSWQSARDDDAGTELDLGLISGAGVPLPQDAWRCDFTATSAAPVAGDFTFTVDEALTPLSAPMSVDASMVDVSCDTGATCGDGILEAAEECDDGGATAACDGDCRLTRNSQRCAVTFVASGTGSLGGLQFGVDYSDASGAFQGEGVSVDCSQALASSFTAVEDVDADQRLNLALISPGGLAMPTDLWTCTFVTSATALVKSNFHYLEVIGTDVEANSKIVTLSSRVSACVYGPYCGDGTVDPGETCDDGNSVNTDSCSNTCTIPVSLCGNGVKNAGEQCDDGNTKAGDCCSAGCTFESAATVCRAAAGACDQAETCTGTTATCPANLFKSSATVCRPAAGVCDLAESCTGASPACPADSFQSSSTSCTDDSNACTNDKCNGSGACAHPFNSAPCNDGLFCNGADTCGGGTCSLHAGNPCPGADGDGDCSETCAEAADACSGNDPDLSACDDGNANTTADRCTAGTCAGTSGPSICGDANANGSLSSTDALKILKAGVGLPEACPPNRCDTDQSGSISSSDALRVLKAAVGQPVVLTCPA